MKKTTEDSHQLFDKKLLESIGKKFLRRKETVAVAESVTAGLLQYGFSNIPDAAHFFHGGITAYNIGQKYKHLKVEPLHAQSVNCVSQQVAEEMALHVCEQFGSHWGLGITGYASPVPESDDKVFAYYAVAASNKIVASGKITAQKMDPPLLQLQYARHVFTVLNKQL